MTSIVAVKNKSGLNKVQCTTSAEKSQGEISGRVCRKCRRWKPRTEFHKHSRTKDGLQSYCRACIASYGKRWLQDNKEHRKATQKRWYSNNKETALIYSKAWRKANRERLAILRQRWCKRNPERCRKARQTSYARYSARHPERLRTRRIATKAIRTGRLVPQPCEWPGCTLTKGTQAHHKDYNKPVEVIWLCLNHHQLLHSLGLKVPPKRPRPKHTEPDRVGVAV